MQVKEGVELKDAGSNCQSCFRFWAHQQMPPKRMVSVFTEDGKPMLTDKKNIPIVICPYCDGDIILRLTKKDTRDEAKLEQDSGPLQHGES